MKFYLVILFLNLNLILCSKNQTRIDKCLNHKGDLPKSIYIQGCDTVPCVVRRDKSISIEFEFVVTRPVKSMRTLATGYLKFLFISFPKSINLGEYEVACKYLTNTQCPINQRALAHFAATSIEVAHINLIPKGTKATVEFRIVDENDEALTCGRIPLIIA